MIRLPGGDLMFRKLEKLRPPPDSDDVTYEHVFNDTNQPVHVWWQHADGGRAAPSTARWQAPKSPGSPPALQLRPGESSLTEVFRESQSGGRRLCISYVPVGNAKCGSREEESDSSEVPQEEVTVCKYVIEDLHLDMIGGEISWEVSEVIGHGALPPYCQWDGKEHVDPSMPELSALKRSDMAVLCSLALVFAVASWMGLKRFRNVRHSSLDPLLQS
eukprot:gnl/TRDRNA2_/TRDRNA2_156943_c1_seq4.p1 gnl/TRDRNA2_/TRDRNA2_156943_c1~~gnl/TRDRNA2_/TRDRNA2_156943_c1_seq4.p1  ORF type:complete len:217 (+),score=18.52 gnl/TRDRNA2_/TRDRNA2_156943_c1_seq4:70-720(+)